MHVVDFHVHLCLFKRVCVRIIAGMKCGSLHDTYPIRHFGDVCVCLTIVPVPEVVDVSDGVDGEVVDDAARGHEGVSLRVNVGVTFPGLARTELWEHTRRGLVRACPCVTVCVCVC